MFLAYKKDLFLKGVSTNFHDMNAMRIEHKEARSMTFVDGGSKK